MEHLFRLACCWAVLLSLMSAQNVPLDATSQSAVPIIELEPATSPTAISEPLFGSVLVGMACGSDSSVYLRTSPPYANPFLVPVVRITSKGNLAAKFEVAKIPGIETAKQVFAYVFAVAQNGGLYQIAEVQPAEGSPKLYLIKYGQDGSFRSKTELSFVFRPYAFAALPSGGFFISGTGFESSDAKKPAKPVTGLFDDHGRLTGVLETWKPGGDEAGKDSQGAANPKLSATPLADHGVAKVGPDQLLYLLRLSPPTVYVFNERGEKLRQFAIRGPSPNMHASADLWVGQTTVLVQLYGEPQVNSDGTRKPGPAVMAVYDTSGNPRVLYARGTNIKGVVSCYEDYEVTLLLSTSSGLSLGKLALRH